MQQVHQPAGGPRAHFTQLYSTRSSSRKKTDKELMQNRVKIDTLIVTIAHYLQHIQLVRLTHTYSRHSMLSQRT